MEGQIISPWVLYIIHLLNGIGIVAWVGIFLGVFTVISGFVALAGTLCSSEDTDIDEKKELVSDVKKFLNISKYILIVSVIVAVVTPNPKTSYKMLAAHYITTDHIKELATLGKDAKETLKQDILEIISEVGEKKD